MTTTVHGGDRVPGGYYLSQASWQVVPVEKDGDRLAGSSSETFVRVPAAAALLMLPALGGLLVLFLPFIGLSLALQAALRPLTGLFHRSARDLAATVTPGWAPGAAHFTGRSASAREERMRAGEARLDDLAREIEARRQRA